MMDPVVNLVRQAMGYGVMMALEGREDLIAKLCTPSNDSLADALTSDAQGFVRTRADLVDELNGAMMALPKGFHDIVDGYAISDSVDLGDGVAIEYWRTDGVIGGIFWRHGCTAHDTDGYEVRSPVAFDIPENDRDKTWQVESRNPLTLSPSLLCTICGRHGFIREDRWVPA